MMKVQYEVASSILWKKTRLRTSINEEHSSCIKHLYFGLGSHYHMLTMCTWTLVTRQGTNVVLKDKGGQINEIV